MTKTDFFFSEAPSRAPHPKVVRAHEGDCLELPREGRLLLLESCDTHGALALARTRIARGAGAPPHIHTREDELFWVEGGEFEFRVGSHTVTLGAGDFAFGPRGVPHSYTCSSDGGTLLVAVAQAGFEQFFRDVARLLTDSLVPLPRAEVQALALQHGVHIGAPEELERLAKHLAPPLCAPKIVRAGQGERLQVAHEQARVLLGSEEAGGALCVCESQTPSLCGPPERRHASMDITFVILAGRYEFCLGDARVQAAEGDVVWIPCGAPHGFRVVSPEPGRALLLSTPGGLDDFLRAPTS